MAVAPCCLKGFEWDGTPTGRIEKLAGKDAYVTGSNPSAAILIVHDLFGWAFSNVRLLADHYAREADATVYVPDFFDGDSLDLDLLLQSRFAELDLAGFMQRNARDVREPDILASARALRERHARLGAVGFCYGGWAVFRLGGAEHDPPLVDCVTAGHPSLLTAADVDSVAVPVQVLAPQIDGQYTAELKAHTLTTLLAKGLEFDFQHFPGVEHACFVRGDQTKAGEREAMEKGKDAAVAWLKRFLHSK